MSPAMHRTPPSAARPNRPYATRNGLEYGWSRPSNGLAAVALVLSAALSLGDPDERPAERAAGSPANADDRFAAAVRLYESRHWDQAYASLAALADHGHAAAAKLALLMLRYGAALYDTSFEAQPQQVARWAQRVLRATSRATASPSSMTAIA